MGGRDSDRPGVLFRALAGGRLDRALGIPAAIRRSVKPLCNRLNEVEAPALTMEQRHQDPAAGFAFPAVCPLRLRTLSRSSRWSRRGARRDSGLSLDPDY